MITSTDMKEIKLPNLPGGDISKLDELLAYMKENDKEFIDIYKVCKNKWGDNKLLYLFFAEYLKKNSFTLVENYSKGEEYMWKQMISPRGLALDSFKKELARQRKKKKAETPQKFQSRIKGITGIARSLFLITTVIFGVYIFRTGNKSETGKIQEPSVDSFCS